MEKQSLTCVQVHTLRRSAKKALSQAVLLISGAIMLGFGAMRGEVETVLSKAIRLCLECVGIG